MPLQSPLRTVKRWQRYVPRLEWSEVPRNTRGFYVLYVKRQGGRYEVSYIGISGTGRHGGRIRSRLRSHTRHKDGWTHFSLFEVHNNITGEEIREVEALLLQIFRHDPRIRLSNVQTGSRKFSQTRKTTLWEDRNREERPRSRRSGNSSEPW